MLVAELGLDRLDAVKIDVEGLEVDVLHGATDTLRRFRPVVYGEFDNQLMPKLGVTFLDAWSLFEPLGYQCFSFRHRLHLVHRPDPPATLGHVVLATPDRLDGLAEQDSSSIGLDVGPHSFSSSDQSSGRGSSAVGQSSRSATSRAVSQST